MPGPRSAGAIADAGILFFRDYDGPSMGRPDYGRSFLPGLYRYDGAFGNITKLSDYPFGFGGGLTHETSAGIYMRGMQGRWDLLRWDGTHASEKEFTACQPEDAIYASWCAVSATGVGVGWGSHTGSPCKAPPAFIRRPSDPRGAALMPGAYCVIGAQISADGTQVLVSGLAEEGAAVQGVCRSGATEIDGICHRSEVWVMTVGGAPRRLTLTPELPGVGGLDLSPDGRSATAEHLGALFHVDLSSGRTTSLGPVQQQHSARWSSNGRLAFVRGGGTQSWAERTVIVVAPDGSSQEVRPKKADGAARWPSALAPAWDPTGSRLAWIASATSAVSGASGAAEDYLHGRGVGDRRVLVSDLASEPSEVRCGEGVAEGVRWSHDGSALLLLCRRPGVRVDAFDLWLHRLNVPGTAVPIVRGLTLGGVDANGYPPSLFGSVAWSRGLVGQR